MKKYFFLAALSGCTWAVIAYVLSLGAFSRGIVVGGLIASPLIGTFIGWIFLPAYKLPKFVQFALSLVTLYIAVALFGIGVGLYDATRDIPSRSGSFDVVLQAVIASVIGITMTGYVLLLWPLAFLNHRLLRRACDGAR
jgi:uncharacterized membrane protein YczE